MEIEDNIIGTYVQYALSHRLSSLEAYVDNFVVVPMLKFVKFFS